MNELLALISWEYINEKPTETGRREVFARVASIGMREFYQASTTDFHPELKFILPDYLEYGGETLVEHESRRYHVLRTYRTGQELELIVEKATAEEASI